MDTWIHVEHPGSMTMKRSPRFQALMRHVGGLHAQYYVMKWGGLPGEERYLHPFNDPALVDLLLDRNL